jgi:hypothetical protein
MSRPSAAALTDRTGLVCVGFSAYEGLGGGLQFCRDNSIDNADGSLCAEFGEGPRRGMGRRPRGRRPGDRRRDRRGGHVEGRLGGGHPRGELDLDCLNFKGSAKAQYGPAGKIAYKRCAKF